MKKKLMICLVVLITTTVFSQTFNNKHLDTLFQILQEKDKFMGSLAVSKNGKLLYSKTIGYADLQSGQKANTKTKYRIGSISKIFTASLILKAMEEKKINLNQTLDHYFPKLKTQKKSPLKICSITEAVFIISRMILPI